jgi:hypothetical protein
MGRRSVARILSHPTYGSDPDETPKQRGYRPNLGPMTDHHMVPKSRKGTRKDGNILRLPKRIHEAWHTLVGIMKPEEAVCYIIANFFPDNRIDFVLLRKGDVEICIKKDGILELRRRPASGGSMPNFDDLGHSPFVHRVSRRPKPK